MMTQQKQLDEIKGYRFKNFIMRDKDRYICYRFVIELEELLTYDKSQINMSTAIREGEVDSGDSIVIEVTPKGVYERYVYPMAEDYHVSHEQLEKIKELAHQYCRYLTSNADDRIRYYGEDKEAWDKFI